MPPPVLTRALRAAVRPAQLGLLGVGVAAAGAAVALGGVVGGLVPAFAIGALTVVGWGAATAWDTLYAPTVSGPQIVDPAIRARLGAVLEAAAAIDRALGESDGAAAWYAEARGTCAALVDNARRLATRADELDALRDGVDVRALDVERRDLQERATKARGRDVANQWREAVRRKEGQIGHYRQIDATIERIHAELATVEGALGELHARIVSQDGADTDLGASARETLRALDDEIGSVERAAAATLKEMGR